MKQLFFVLTLFFYTGLFAQTSLDDKIDKAKFDVIKRTVEFLSTDTATFKDSKNHHCEPCKDYDELRAFAAKLSRAPELITELENTKVKDNKDELKKFIAKVRTKITTGAPNKVRRASADNYKVYSRELDKIADDFSSQDSQNPNTANADSSSTKRDTTSKQTDKTLGAATPGATGPPHDAPPDPTDIPSWPYLAAGAVLVLLALYFFMGAKKENKKKEQLKQDLRTQKELVKSKDESISDLKIEVQSLKAQLTDMDGQLTALVERQDAERRKYQQKVKEAREEKAPDVTKETITEQQPRGFEPIVKYARYADTGDGFSSANLLDSNDSETIFEITITAPGTGAYRITSNQQAQKYALANASYFLNNTCVYDSLPSADSNIITNHPGKLVLQDNKWVISNPARISFN